MKKTLKLYVVAQNKMRVTFQIVEQSHRRDEFGYCGSNFVASNGVILRSFSSPCVGNNELYVRGSNRRSDQQLMVAYLEDWKKITAAVDEYNKFEFEEIKMTEEEKIDWLKSLKVGDWVSLVKDDLRISVNRQIVGEANTFWKLNCGQKPSKLTGKALLGWEIFPAPQSLQKKLELSKKKQDLRQLFSSQLAAMPEKVVDELTKILERDKQ